MVLRYEAVIGVGRYKFNSKFNKTDVMSRRLLNGLSSERVRWVKTIKELAVANINLIGDILLSACQLSFFTSTVCQSGLRM